MPPRKVSDVPASVVRVLSEGERESRDLVEAFCVDFAVLLEAALPGIPEASVAIVRDGASLAYTKRMRLAARVALEHAGDAAFDRLRAHPSDTARGWAAFIAGLTESPLADRLERVRPLADDAHFGVREWAWLGIRDAIVEQPRDAVELLEPWTRATSENLRRFASEATRPRGVWAKHIAVFKADPELCLPILEPLWGDPSRYVQDSVGNWLNDAAKTRPDWVRGVCDRWLAASESLAPEGQKSAFYTARRAMRSLRSGSSAEKRKSS